MKWKQEIANFDEFRYKIRLKLYWLWMREIPSFCLILPAYKIPQNFQTTLSDTYLVSSWDKLSEVYFLRLKSVLHMYYAAALEITSMWEFKMSATYVPGV